MWRSSHFGVAEAVHDMVVHEAARLHERVADRRADEAEAALLQILAHRLRLWRLGGDLPDLAPAVHERLAVDEAPEVLAQALELEDAAGIVDGRLDLEPVADDAGIGEQALDLLVREAGDFRRVEAAERLAIALTLAQDRRPREAGLRALEREHLEQV